MVLLMMMMWWCWLSGDEVEGIFRRCASLSTLKEVQEKYNSGELFIGVCLKINKNLLTTYEVLWDLMIVISFEWTHMGVNWRSKYITQVQRQRLESPTATLTWHACKHKVHKLHLRYIFQKKGGGGFLFKRIKTNHWINWKFNTKTEIRYQRCVRKNVQQ